MFSMDIEGILKEGEKATKRLLGAYSGHITDR